MTESEHILEIKNLRKYFMQTSGVTDLIKDYITGQEPSHVHAVDDIDIAFEHNQVQGIIGESGCGKSTLLRTLIGLEKPTSGEIIFEGTPISEFKKRDWKEYRRRVQVIFQDPFNSLDPKMTVRATLREILSIHNLDVDDEKIKDILSKVELNPPEKYLPRFPKELSGGEKQRVSIARALILNPDILLADEPVSMLDVSTQASILNLLQELTEDFGLTMIYVSHDLSTVSYICDRINVMYLGRIVERAPTSTIINGPKHPYTRALIRSIPIPDPHFNREKIEVSGTPGDSVNLPEGCRFKDRCPKRMNICDITPLEKPVDKRNNHSVACHLHYDHREAMHADESPLIDIAGKDSEITMENRNE